jgi:uncharacterized protein (TIGR02246 family)
MNKDEAEIRQLVATWAAATQAGDIETVLDLMTEDVVFLLPNQHSMIGRAAFKEATLAMASQGAATFEGKSDIQEITVTGEWAFMWTKLQVVITPPDGGATMTRAGFTMSVLRKDKGKWRIARDANLLSPVASTAT